MPNSSTSRRDFLRGALGVVVVASTSPLVVLGRIIPTITTSNSGQLVATYVIHVADYPALDPIYGSIKLSTPEQLQLNPDHVSRAFTGKSFPIAVTRVAASGEDAFKAVSTYCTHGFDYALKDFNPVTMEFVCPHKGSSFQADGTHIVKRNTPDVGNLRTFKAVYSEAENTITLENVLGVADVDDSEGIPESQFLEQNFPNPFNPVTIFRYGLAQPAHAVVTVHALDGTLLETLVDADQQAGIHVMEFSATMLPSGTYFYKLTTEHGVQVRRMVVRK